MQLAIHVMPISAISLEVNVLEINEGMKVLFSTWVLIYHYTVKVWG